MGRNLRGRLSRLERQELPHSEINWNALFAHDLPAFIASLPAPPTPPPEQDYVEAKIASLTGATNDG